MEIIRKERTVLVFVIEKKWNGVSNFGWKMATAEFITDNIECTTIGNIVMISSNYIT